MKKKYGDRGRDRQTDRVTEKQIGREKIGFENVLERNKNGHGESLRKIKELGESLTI